MPASSPYASLPNTSFWKRSVAGISALDVDPVLQAPFAISEKDAVATAGSCFAQHISRTLSAKGFNYFVTEFGPEERGYGVYPSRFGNIYTVRQLLQTFERAYGLREADPSVWVRGEKFVDPFRPQIEADGFSTTEALEADRATHLASVRKMFEGCDVFIFTLGLTEGWQTENGTVVPLAPGVAGGPENPLDIYSKKNFSVNEMVSDFNRFLSLLRTVNPDVKVLLTVSPVPLIATYEDNHVLQSNTYSKSALRVAAQSIVDENENVFYFPSYEIITGLHNGNRYFEADLRSVTPEGVANVMSVFSKHYLGKQDQALSTPSPIQKQNETVKTDEVKGERHELYEIICDEEAVDP